jgi:formate hydrogenlyase subunit 4
VNVAALVTQLFAVAVAVVLAPLFLGWVNMCRAWLQNRSAPPLTQPYRMIRKLLRKDAVIATDASPLFVFAPYVIFGSMVTAAAIIPALALDLPFARAADAIALVGLFATARVFVALAAIDTGTAFGTLGARREMMLGFLAEPALLMVFFTASLIAGSTELPVIADLHQYHVLAIHPGLAFAAIAFLMVLLAENARIPVDNPSTHLELTMIHEAMVLEYSARHLALIEWAAALKLFNYACIGFALFVPWGVARDLDAPQVLALALVVLCAKLLVAGAVLALIETLNAKIRIFRAPEFLALAFMLAVLGLLVRLLLQS